jgi:hypothetical protein
MRVRPVAVGLGFRAWLSIPAHAGATPALPGRAIPVYAGATGCGWSGVSRLAEHPGACGRDARAPRSGDPGVCGRDRLRLVWGFAPGWVPRRMRARRPRSQVGRSRCMRARPVAVGLEFRAWLGTPAHAGATPALPAGETPTLWYYRDRSTGPRLGSSCFMPAGLPSPPLHTFRR